MGGRGRLTRWPLKGADRARARVLLIAWGRLATCGRPVRKHRDLHGFLEAGDFAHGVCLAWLGDEGARGAAHGAPCMCRKCRGLRPSVWVGRSFGWVGACRLPGPAWCTDVCVCASDAADVQTCGRSTPVADRAHRKACEAFCSDGPQYERYLLRDISFVSPLILALQVASHRLSSSPSSSRKSWLLSSWGSWLGHRGKLDYGLFAITWRGSIRGHRKDNGGGKIHPKGQQKGCGQPEGKAWAGSEREADKAV